MKVFTSTLFLLFASSTLPAATQAVAGCTFPVNIDNSNECDFDTLARHLTNTCGTDGAAVLAQIFDTDEDGARAALEALCDQALARLEETEYVITIPDSQAEGDDAKRGYLKTYYNGAANWNEQVATKYPRFEKQNQYTYLLEDDAANINALYQNGEGSEGKLEFPTFLNNFLGRGGGHCAWNTAYCCWPTDRQAGDNNGNCNTPYDKNCVDKDPADNTDLCYVDTNEAAEVTGLDTIGTTIFPGDDDNNQDDAEGPIHCHGLAWEDNTNDLSFLYRGNNLFYVSMYDHMYQRGYVRNIQGAPMCGCAEYMPTVSRSDCTELEMTISYQFALDDDQPTITVSKTKLTFNACQGTDRYGDDDDNDLWSYVHRLFLEGKITDGNKLVKLSEKMVGDDPNACDSAIKKQMATAHGVVRGHSTTRGWRQFLGREGLFKAHGYGLTGFTKYFLATPNRIIKRLCANCEYTHREVYYKYLNDEIPEGLHILDDLAYQHHRPTEGVPGNEYGKDFLVYSTYEDAVNDENEWECENYKYQELFPGGCSPDGGTVRKQGSSFTRFQLQQHDVGYYLEKVNKPFSTLGSIMEVGEKHADGFAFEDNGLLYISGVGSFNGGTEESLDLYVTNRDKNNFQILVEYKKFYCHDRACRTGLMLRKNSDKDSPFVGIWVSGVNRGTHKIGYGYRQEAGESMHWDERTAVGDGESVENVKLRISREGNMYTVEYNIRDGGWSSLTSSPIEWNVRNVRSGVFVSSYSTTRVGEATISKLEYTPTVATV